MPYDGGIRSVNGAVATVSVGGVLPCRRSCPAGASVVLQSAEEPGARCHVLCQVFELGYHKAVVQVLPGHSAVGTCEHSTVAADVQAIRVARFETDGVLIRMDRVSRRPFGGDVDPGPGVSVKVTSICINGTEVDLLALIRRHGQEPVVPGLRGREAWGRAGACPSADGPPPQISLRPFGAPGVGNRGVTRGNSDSQAIEGAGSAGKRHGGPGEPAVRGAMDAVGTGGERLTCTECHRPRPAGTVLGPRRAAVGRAVQPGGQSGQQAVRCRVVESEVVEALSEKGVAAQGRPR